MDTPHSRKEPPCTFLPEPKCAGKTDSVAGRGSGGEGDYCQIHMGYLFGVKGSLTIALKSTCHLSSKQQKKKTTLNSTILLLNAPNELGKKDTNLLRSNLSVNPPVTAIVFYTSTAANVMVLLNCLLRPTEYKLVAHFYIQCGKQYPAKAA